MQALDSERQKHAAVWFPHDLLQDLATQLSAAELGQQLISALRQHRQAVEEQSSRLQQNGMEF